ncbi:hypothetical protein BDV98DRAFT_68738 [Pterulicium gracile]|uniref:Thioredoxin-like fold domain-containing protein n=1 Tax=Pterulicium gracile TaxID=1884261 RepID=A0A5C3QNB7_9AGAR|nr:hypothetical protein BDV98DRAFT_68738 [Pterula gracilis]
MSLSIELYGFSKPTKGPSPSGYCQKLEAFFRAQPSLSNVYIHVPLDQPSKAPKGKLPYIVLINGTGTPLTLPDSQFIINHFISTGLTPSLDASLTPSQRAESKAFQVWTDDLAYPAVAFTRFGDTYPANYDKIYNSIALPSVLNYAPFKPMIMWNMRRHLQGWLWAQGVGRHTKEEVESIILEWVQAIQAKVGEHGEWFHRTKQPTQVDVVLTSFLMHYVGMVYNPETVGMIREEKGVVRYTIRAVELWFPEYEKLLEMLRSWL